MKALKLFLMCVCILSLCALPVFSQEVDPEPDPPTEVDPDEPDVEEPEDDGEEPEDDGEEPEDTEAEDDGEPKELNAEQQDKAERLAEAAGVSVEEIEAMRRGEAVEAPEGEEPDVDAPKGRGWGVIAKWLGLHPSSAGKSKKNLDDAEDPDGEVDEDLPDPPELDEEALEAAGAASDKAAAKAERKAERKEAKLAKAEAKKNSARAKDKGSVGKDKQKDRGKPEKNKPEKPARKDNAGKKK